MQQDKYRVLCMAINHFLECGAVATVDSLQYFTKEAKEEAMAKALASDALTDSAKELLKEIKL